MVADALREAIVKGWLAPGERVKEIPLAEQLGVSRGPIREALRLLAHDGLVTIIPNRGAVVPTPTSSDVLEVYAMRSALGSLALRKLMLEDTELPVRALERELARLARAVARDKAHKPPKPTSRISRRSSWARAFRASPGSSTS